MTDPNRNALERFLTAGASIVAAGTGVLYTSATGDQLGGAAGSALLASVAGELAHRALSSREEARIGGVLAQASAALVLRDIEGNPLREDSFMSGTPSSWDEAAEATLLAAKGQYEERKIPFLGNALAFIATDSGIDGSTANALIRNADRLSWLDMRVLAIFGSAERYPMPTREPGWEGATAWFDWTVSQSFNSMMTDALNYLTFGRTEAAEGQIAGLDLNLSATHLTNSGRLLVSAMRLSTITQSELDPIYHALTGELPPSRQD